MTINCFNFDDDQRLIPCDYAQAYSWANDAKGRVWFDVQDPEQIPLSDLLEKLKISSLAQRLCSEAREQPGFYPLSDLILMIIPVQAVSTDVHEMDYVTVLHRHNFLLTIRNSRYTQVQKITSLQESADWLAENSLAGFVCGIILFLSLELLQRLSDLRKDIISVEREMDQESYLVNPKELSEKRTRLLVLEAIVSGQIPAFQALLSTEKPFFGNAASREQVVNALANLQAADRSLQWLGGRIDVIRADLELLSQDKTNRRLGRLTTLSAIFMPITFLAGIWGMNFEHMPELSQPGGYWLALGTMVLLATALFLFFKKKGWLN